MTTIEELGRRAKQASRLMNRMGTTQKNQILALAAQALVDEQEEILKANAMDIKAAREKNMPSRWWTVWLCLKAVLPVWQRD